MAKTKGLPTKQDLCNRYNMTLPQLRKALLPIADEIGWVKAQQAFTPKAYRAIIDYLGEPINA